MRHVLHLLDFSPEELHQLLVEACHLKAARQRRIHTPSLMGRVLSLVFEKPSLRTRVSFQSAIAQLGGASLFLSGKEAGLGCRESLPDVARTISQYVDAVVLRTFSQDTIEEFAQHAECPVINGLSNLYHPCQALSDVFTVKEIFGDLAGRTITFVGDGNNVARSLAIACGKLGIKLILAAPKEFQFDDTFLKILKTHVPQVELEQSEDLRKAVKSADIIYTDVWTSMGQEAEENERKNRLASYQVNAELLALAPTHARVMHCLPAKRGEEITSEVLDGDQSVVFQQAANRMHAQKALLFWLMK